MSETEGWEGLTPGLQVKPTADEVDILYGKVFKTSEGQRVLAHLKNMTIEQPVFIPGEDPSFGYARAGMCEIVRMIFKRVERSNNE